MRITTRNFIMAGIFTFFLLGFSGCISGESDQAASSRPECVTLDSYSNVIWQVMNTQPAWNLLNQNADGSQYQWLIEDKNGKHTLTTKLSPDGCVCATEASSQYKTGNTKTEIVGLLQGAAVAPISDLEYTASWLEPKVSFACGIAFLFQHPNKNESLMSDGTIWTLSCSRNSEITPFDTQYTFTIVAPNCGDKVE